MVSSGDQLAIEQADLVVRRLGQAAVPSPMARLLRDRASSPHYVHESDRVLLDDTAGMAVARDCAAAALPSLEPGGPREYLYFDPAATRAGVVSCGGLCPGLNNVIRGLVLELAGSYGVSVPKTIDNDIPYLDHSFGFQTAFARAADSIKAAHTEASSTPNGVGLVKLMGRHSGFIACYAALANHDADFVLVPEVPFCLDGSGGFLASLRRRVQQRGHAVVVVAEGAGQDLCAPGGTAPGGTAPGGTAPGGGARDASGNIRLADIGRLLRDRITADFAAAGMAVNLRYVDPGYAIRSVPANAYDAVFCLRLAQAAVHAAMAGRTAMAVGRWHGRFVHLPISLVTGSRNVVDPDGDLWMAVLEATGQPPRFCAGRTAPSWPGQRPGPAARARGGNGALDHPGTRRPRAGFGQSGGSIRPPGHPAEGSRP